MVSGCRSDFFLGYSIKYTQFLAMATCAKFWDLFKKKFSYSMRYSHVPVGLCQVLAMVDWCQDLRFVYVLGIEAWLVLPSS